MDNQFIQSREAILYARDALRRGDMTTARRWAEQAAELAPQSEDPWLILAAIASPRESVDYVRRALQANPNSPRGRKAMEWAMQRLGEPPQAKQMPENGQQATLRHVHMHPVQVSPSTPLGSLSKGRVEATQKVVTQKGSPQKRKGRSLVLPILLVVMGCAVFGFAAYSAVTSPVLASILNFTSQQPAAQNHPQQFAAVELAKPTYTAMPITPTQALAYESGLAIPQQRPTEQATEIPPLPTLTLTDVPSIAETFTPEVTSTPGVMYAEIVPDTPTPEYAAPAEAPDVSPEVMASGVHWIDVNLSQQRVYAYAGDTLVNSFIVSTGTWQTPTVTGKYKIWIKLLATDMAGPGYYLPDVPYTMYFYKGYALHGTYWHNNFGTPMSHGCVNLSIPDAEWLYNFSAVGTVVNVHY
ncbi:MAG: L,D-transpeptidase family protein [Chloroflexota bacterium]